MMKSTHDLHGRLRNLMPVGVQPKFISSQELMAWQQEEGRKRAAELEKQNQRNRSERNFGRSGICELHGGAFANSQVSNDGQKHALTMAKSYAHNFGNGFTSFIFSGSCVLQDICEALDLPSSSARNHLRQLYYAGELGRINNGTQYV